MKTCVLTTGLAVLIVLFAAMEPAPVRAQEQSPLPYEVLYISGKIIYPGQITRSAGPFLLVIKNQSRLKKLVIHIKQARAITDALQASLEDRNDNYDAVVNLPPGTYEVSEPGHPQLKCTLTITE